MVFLAQDKKKLPITQEELLRLLKNNKIKFDYYAHKPLFSVKESKLLQEVIFPNDLDSIHIKNLYLRDKNKNNFLITCEQDKNIDLKKLQKQVMSSRLSFGSSERLFEFLGVYPGSVSPFCMINGIKKNVNFYCDITLKKYKKIFLHPFINDTTIRLEIIELEKFLNKYHINFNWIDL